MHSSTYIGDSGEEDFGEVLVTSNGIYVVGSTKSENFPVSLNAYDKEHNGSDDVFVIKIDEEFSPVSGAEESELKREFRLNNNYPNPFNPSTNISFSLSKSVPVKLDLFNCLGELVRNLIDSDLIAGEYEINWDGRFSSNKIANSGVYYCRLSAGDYTEVRKMILQK